MANPAGAKGRKEASYAVDSMGPPKKGCSMQYERLLVEESSLNNDRKDFRKSEQSRSVGGHSLSASPTTNDKVQTLKIRGMTHRASIGGMLIAVQHAADKVKSDPAAAAEYERGLERAEAKHNIAALRMMKSRQLEEDDYQIPHDVGSESMAWRHQLSSKILVRNDMKGPAVLEATNACEDFFSAFSECRRKDDASYYSGMDESDSDDNDSIGNEKPKAKRKKEAKKAAGSNETTIVTCSSASPSPERLAQKSEGRTVHDNAATGNTLKNQWKQSDRNQQKQPLSSNPSSNLGSQHPPNRELNESNNSPHPHQYSQRPNSSKYTNNPYKRQNQRGSYQNQVRNGSRQHQNQVSAFDYNDNGLHHNMDGPSELAVKKNQFCTAGELGTNFNDKPREGDNGGRRHRSNEWDNNGNIGDAYSGNSNQRRTGGIGGMNSRSTSSAVPRGPQQMVKTALQGPKTKLSAGLQKRFQDPMKSRVDSGGANGGRQHNGNNNSKSSNAAHQQSGGGNACGGNENEDGEDLPEELRGCDKKLVEMINNEIVDSGEKVKFDHIAGLKNAKDTVFELIIMPMKRPDLFTGLRSIPKGMLLFGPPGTGKTLIGKAIAHESGATFFSISSSSLTSKWIGEGEKLVRTLFAVASYRAPSVVFIDEVDSMLTQRKADENDASRRIKTQFLVELDGAKNERQKQVLVIGATNLPQELDDAARRRFVKKLYIPLPDQPSRRSLIATLLQKEDNKHSLTDDEITKLSHNTDGFSGADLKNLCVDAAMGPVRQLGMAMMSIAADDVPSISYKHFRQSLRGMSPSVAQSDLTAYIEWNNTYGNKAANIGGGYESDTGDENENS
eukprot:CAMPEP_0181123056 /NCGR_PEP_ID=MMETSP1071-20121207/25668_1 /TAXON_ID=35127 /ORGANISM="Thalassiosira sp., Strain NH16" /LENGTH=841 /DNA_ID=CAMNT_0023208117 /DNA_START=14 /DNA_END=2539 /DNA_ORIENTATION=+